MPYLSFRSTAGDAMRFYQSVFGGQLTVVATQSVGSGKDASAGKPKVLHLMLAPEPGLVLIAADIPGATDHVPGTSHPVALNIDRIEQLHRIWEALSRNGRIVVPLTTTPQNGTRGICVDRYGVEWLLGTGYAGLTPS